MMLQDGVEGHKGLAMVWLSYVKIVCGVDVDGCGAEPGLLEPIELS